MHTKSWRTNQTANPDAVLETLEENQDEVWSPNETWRQQMESLGMGQLVEEILEDCQQLDTDNNVNQRAPQETRMALLERHAKLDV